MKYRIKRTGGLAIVVANALAATACLLPFDAGQQAGPPSGASATGVESSSDPESEDETDAALEILERMSAFLASREAFRFRAEVEYDAVQPSGQRIEFGNSREVAMRRPDRLRIDVFDRDGTSEILSYDGTEVWIASPSRNAYSRMPQLGRLEQVLEQLANDYDTPAQLAELMDPDLYRQLHPAIESGSRVGLVRLDGRLCEQLAFRTEEVDFQLFIERGETPMPRRLVIDYRNEPGKPQFRATLGDWDLAPELPDTHFRVSPPIGAQRVPFDELHELMMAAPDALPDPGDTP
jgi:hypothetical protein